MFKLMPFSRRALRAAAALAAMAPTAAAAQTACAAGETSIAVGDPRIAALVPSAADTVDMWIEHEGQVRPLGTYYLSVEPVRDGGGPAWLVVQRTEMPGRTVLDSVTVRAGTFAPLRHVASTPAHTADVRFAAGRATGTVADSGRARAVDDAVAATAFDYSVFSMLFPALELCEGATVEFETYDITRGPVTVMATVAAPETVTLGDRAWDVWPVDVGLRQVTSRLYIDRRTRREVGWMVSLPGGRVMKGATRARPAGGHAARRFLSLVGER
jgi:hypothetical protein